MPRRSEQPIREITDLVAETQQYGDRLIRLSEYSSSEALTLYQREVLIEQGERLDSLGLELIPHLDGSVSLKASQIVGSTRFVNKRRDLIVQVEPKMGNANFFQMLNHLPGSSPEQPDATIVASEKTTPVAIFVEYFTNQILRFLHRSTYRSYYFETSKQSTTVKGKPLIREYITKTLPIAKPQIMPCQYLEFSSDVLENQIILYATQIAVRMTAFYSSEWRTRLLRKIKMCERLLASVSLKRITLSDIDAIRYNRTNAKFEYIHQICRMLIGGYSVSLKVGDKVPFMSLTLDMADLFEKYIAALFSGAFGRGFVGEKSKIVFPISGVDKNIILDGLLVHQGLKSVVECKYKNISRHNFSRASSDRQNINGAVSDDFELLDGRIKGADLYQTSAYGSHQAIQSDLSMLVYPVDNDERNPVVLAKPITSFGWGRPRATGRSIYLVGVNLSADFSSTVKALKETVDKTFSVAVTS